MLPLRHWVVAAALVGGVASCTGLLGDFTLSNTSPKDGGTDVRARDGSVADASDAGKGDASREAGDAGGHDGGDSSTSSCEIVMASKRSLDVDGGTISADNLRVYNASQTNVLALVRTGTPPSLAYWFRSDRPADAPQLVPLAGPTSSPARLLSSARAVGVGASATYTLAIDSMNNVLLYDWIDTSGIGSPPTSVSAGSTNYQTALTVPTSSGIFYVVAVAGAGAGTYVDYTNPPAPPTILAVNQISTVADTGITDGMRAYRLRDDSVMLLYYAPDSTLHQKLYPPASTSTSSDRLFFTGPIQPVSFLANGSNVDVAVALPTDDAGTTFGLYTGSIPESQLVTFDPATQLKHVPIVAPIATQPCITAYPGKLVVLVPMPSGMDLYVIDTATATVSYTLTGASNILSGDTEIVDCAIGVATLSSTQQSFEVLWTENPGTGAQNLLFAQLRCTQ